MPEVSMITSVDWRKPRIKPQSYGSTEQSPAGKEDNAEIAREEILPARLQNTGMRTGRRLMFSSYTRTKGIHYFITSILLYSIAKTLFLVRHERKEIGEEMSPFTSVEPTLSPTFHTTQVLNDTAICHQRVWNKMYTMSVTPKICHKEQCKEIKCGELLNGNKEDIEIAKQYMTNMTTLPVSLDDIIEMTSDCDLFRSSRGYGETSSSTEEGDFPIAYSILLHTDPHQVERLLRSIYQPQNVFCIHVDQNSHENVSKSMKAIAECFDNVFIASRRERIVYAGISRLQADINCMQDLTKLNKMWKYFINLTGQMYPLKTNLEIVRILKIYNGSNDIEGMSRSRLLRNRFEFRHLTAYNKQQGFFMIPIHDAKSAPPHEIFIVRGSAFGVFSRGFVEFILNDRRAQDLLEWSKDTYSPDEHYWATLHHNYENPHIRAPGAFTGEPSSKEWLATYAAWQRRDPCQGKFVRAVCVFGTGDLSRLLERKELFANKFHIDFEPLGLKCLEAYHIARTECPIPFDDSFYRKLQFVNQ